MLFFELPFLTLLFFLCAGHALCDYPLQGDFLAKAKCPKSELGKLYWPHALSAHSLIHGGMVTLITGSLLFGVLETVIHAITDWCKCEGHISLRTDQCIHYGCKLLWALLTVYVMY